MNIVFQLPVSDYYWSPNNALESALRLCDKTYEGCR